MNGDKRPIFYLGSSKKDLQKLPSEVRDVFVQGLYLASLGGTPLGSKALKGFGGGKQVIELIEDYRSDTYRAVYTVRLKAAIYVLHVFKKKSNKGIATPKKDKDMILKRLKAALSYHKEHFKR
ncbi:MAG: type II toxin-antitoxin system RelE/ParE family toxin [Chlamydiota bacterium]